MSSNAKIERNDTKRNNDGPTTMVSRPRTTTPISRRFRISIGTLVLVVLLCLPSALLVVDAFANNLVVTSMGCMTDLSTDEIIMNEDVLPPSESDFPRMHLAVLDENKQPTELTTYDPSIKTLRIAFVNPYSTSEFNDDLQFVVEVEPEGAAEFVGGGAVGCEHNRRVSGRLLSSQAAVVLQINDPTATLRLWSGWATGHNAVRLTHDLMLAPLEESREELEQDIEELEEEIGELEFQNTDAEKTLRDQGMAKLDKLLDTQKDGLEHKRNPLQKPEHIPDELLDPTKQKDLGLEIAAAAAKKAAVAGGDTKTMKEKLNDHQLDLDARAQNAKPKQPHKLTDHTKNRRDDPQKLGMYDDKTDDDLPAMKGKEESPGNDDFLPDEGDVDDADVNGKVYTTTRQHKVLKEPSGHHLGCVFFVACMGIFYLVVGKKRNNKGRRDL